MQQWSLSEVSFELERYFCTNIIDLILSFDSEQDEMFHLLKLNMNSLLATLLDCTEEYRRIYLYECKLLVYWYDIHKTDLNWSRSFLCRFSKKTLLLKDHLGKSIFFYAVDERDIETVIVLINLGVNQFLTDDISLAKEYSRARKNLYS